MNFLEDYHINNEDQLKKFLDIYIPKVINVALKLGINLHDDKFSGDHLGLQVMNSREFDIASDTLKKYSSVIHDEIIHDRRNIVFEFNKAFEIDGIQIPRIEIFEPKPNADINILRPGIEHMAFKVYGYDEFLIDCQNENLAIDKIKEINSSKFFKTSLVDGIEIEFRNDYLGNFN